MTRFVTSTLSVMLLIAMHSTLFQIVAADEVNLSFECTFVGKSNLDPSIERLLPTNWERTSNNTLLESYVLTDDDFTGPAFPTDGKNFLYLYNSNFPGQNLPGDFIEQTTTVDLSNVNGLEFDFGRGSEDFWFEQTYLDINGNRVWFYDSGNEIELENVQIDVSGITGAAVISFGIEITEANTVGPGALSYIDNICLMMAPLLGDVNQDGIVNLLDVQPFVDLLASGGFLIEADINQDGIVDLLDVQPFVVLLGG